VPTVIQEKGRSVYVITRIYWIHVKTEVMVEIVDDRLILDDFIILNSMTNAANSYRKFLKLFQDVIDNDSKKARRVIIFLYDASDKRLKLLCYMHVSD
jgi:competence CoiA-like predicted nuclease